MYHDNDEDNEEGYVDLEAGDWEMDEMICVPASCMKFSLEVRDEEQARHLLTTLRYWVYPTNSTIPEELIDYGLVPENRESLGALVCEFERDFAFMVALQDITSAFIEDHLDVAASHGEFHILWYLHEKYHLPLSRSLCAAAAGNGHIDCLKLLHEHNCPWDARTCEAAAKGNHWCCLKYAHEHKCRWDRSTNDVAALKGHLECLKYSLENGLNDSTYLLEVAAGNGHMAVLQYLVEERLIGFRYASYAACQCAASSGNMECLMYLNQHNFPWGNTTTEAAARNGHLACLRFARQQGCAVERNAAISAARNGHLECLQYLFEDGAVDASAVSGWMLNDAIRNGQLTCVEYLIDILHCVPTATNYDAALLCPIPAKQLEMLRYLESKGCKGGTSSQRDRMTRTTGKQGGFLGFFMDLFHCPE